MQERVHLILYGELILDHLIEYLLGHIFQRLGEGAYQVKKARFKINLSVAGCSSLFSVFGPLENVLLADLALS